MYLFNPPTAARALLPVLLLSILWKCLKFQYSTGLSGGLLLTGSNLRMLMSTLGLLLLIIALLKLCFGRRCRGMLLWGNVFLTALLLADTVFFRYYNGIITIPVLGKINISTVGTVNDSIFTLFQAADPLYFLDLPLLFHLYGQSKKQPISEPPIKKRLCAWAALTTAGCLMFVPAFHQANVRAFVYNENYAVKDLGVLYAHIDSTVSYAIGQVNERIELTQEEAEAIEIFLEQRGTESMELFGAAAGMNLIVIQAEALQSFVIGREIGGVEITPHLNRLIEDSLFFENIYVQTNDGNTSDAEFMINTSLYPLREGAVFYEYPENYYPSLPKVMSSLGYGTYVLHAFQEDFYNRHQMYDTLGFDRYIDADYFEMDDFAGWQGQALSDVSFFRQSLDIINTSEPFYAFYVTLSSHYPFNAFASYPPDTGKYEGTFFGDYLKAMHYCDMAIGRFIDDLKARGLYDTSMIVIYGDHAGVPKAQSEDMLDFLETEDSDLVWTQLQKVPLWVRVPGTEGRRITTLGGQVDILPTAANLLGAAFPTAFGKDLLNTPESYAVLRNGTILTEEWLYLNDQRIILEMTSGNSLELDPYDEIILKLQEELILSDLIIEKDALRP